MGSILLGKGNFVRPSEYKGNFLCNNSKIWWCARNLWTFTYMTILVRICIVLSSSCGVFHDLPLALSRITLCRLLLAENARQDLVLTSIQISVNHPKNCLRNNRLLFSSRFTISIVFLRHCLYRFLVMLIRLANY